MEGKYELAIIKEDQIITYWRKHPADFIEYFWGIKLLEYQKEYVNRVWSNRTKITLYYRR